MSVTSVTIQSFNICSAGRDEGHGRPLRERIGQIADKIIQGIEEHGASIIALQELRTCCLDDTGRPIDPVARIQEIAREKGIILEQVQARNSDHPAAFVQAVLWMPEKVQCLKQESYQCSPKENPLGRGVAACEFRVKDAAEDAPTVRVASVHLSPTAWKFDEGKKVAEQEASRGEKNQIRFVMGDLNAFSSDKVKSYQPIEKLGYRPLLGKGYGEGWVNQDGVAIPGSFVGYRRKDEEGKDILDPFAAKLGIGDPLDWIGGKQVDQDGNEDKPTVLKAFVDTSVAPGDTSIGATNHLELMEKDRMEKALGRQIHVPWESSRPNHVGNALASDHLPSFVTVKL